MLFLVLIPDLPPLCGNFTQRNGHRPTKIDCHDIVIIGSLTVFVPAHVRHACCHTRTLHSLLTTGMSFSINNLMFWHIG